MKNRYCIGTVILGLALLTGCTGLIPPGAAAGMNGTPNRIKSVNDYPEHFVYRIDDHRYMTIEGNSHCDGTIYYYDTHLGIRTAVAETGLTLGGGAFDGYYAVDSEYVAIPAIVFSQTNGALLYVHYSNDEGRTFKQFLAGGYGWGQDIFIVKGRILYVARKSHNPNDGIYQASNFFIGSDVIVDDFQRAVAPSGQRIDVKQVPLDTESPSTQTNWLCDKKSG